jgi:hypothetical protein
MYHHHLIRILFLLIGIGYFIEDLQHAFTNHLSPQEFSLCLEIDLNEISLKPELDPMSPTGCR